MEGEEMTSFNLSTQHYPEKIEEKINKLVAIQALDKKKCTLEKNGDITTYKFSYTKKDREEILQQVANIASDMVQEQVIRTFGKKYLGLQMDLTKKDREFLQELFIANHYMTKEEGVSYISYYVIYVPILHELEKYGQVHIEGWIQFRTAKYTTILKDLMDHTIEEYRTEKEYLECISLIIQSRSHYKSSEKTLHLIPKKQGEMGLLNTDKKDVTKEYITRYCDEMLEDGDLRMEDLLMNIFITVAPKNLIIHQKEKYTNKQFISTLELIFEGHMSYCTGCEYCKETK